MVKRIGLAAAAMALWATAPLGATTYCYTVGSFAACASAVIAVNAGQTQLQIKVQNLSNQVGTAVYGITSFGLYYITPPGATGNITLVSGASNWVNGLHPKLAPGPQVNPGQSVQWLGGARANTNVGPFYQKTKASNWSLVGCGQFSNLNPSVISTCASPISFTFNLTNTSGFDLHRVNFALRGVAVKTLGVTNPVGDAFNCFPTNSTCVASSVPEPATMGLLAAGLLGISAAGLVRRRMRK